MKRKKGPWRQVRIPGNKSIPVLRIKPSNGALGCWDERLQRILIDPALTKPQAETILLHELLHVCESAMLNAGAIERRPDHAFIEGLAPNLLLVLACSGLWGGVSREEFCRFYAKDVQSPRPKRKPGKPGRKGE